MRNRDSEIDTGAISIPDTNYDNSIGISYNLLNAISSSLGISKTQARPYMYEMMHAIDERSLLTDGADGLDDFLKSHDVLSFSINNGYVHFQTADNNDFLKLPVISSRQSQLKDRYYEEAEGIVDTATSGLTDLSIDALNQDLARKNKLRQSLLEARKSVPFLPPSDDSMAVSTELPQLKRPKFYIPKDFWISNPEPPTVIASRYRDKYVCMAHAGELIKREVGSLSELRKLGYVEGHDAWILKKDLMSKDGAEILADIGNHLRIIGNRNGRRTIQEYKTSGSDYLNHLGEFRTGLESAMSKGGPVVMGLLYRNSGYKGDVADYNANIKPEYRSLNTHITYCLGKGFRRLSGITNPKEKPADFIVRNLRLRPNFRSLLQNIRIRVDGKICVYRDGTFVYEDSSRGAVLTTISILEIEDFYFSHHYGGSKVASFTELVGNGLFVSTNVMRLKTENLKQSNLAGTTSDKPDLKPVKILYLKRGQTIRDAFMESVSENEKDFQLFSFYLRLIGFKDRAVRYELDPIPVPDLSAVQKYIDSHGNMSEILYQETADRCKQYEKEHAGEHLMFIERGKNPWDSISTFFSDTDLVLSREERSYILEEIDRLNADIDLRLQDWPIVKDGKIVTVKNYAKWEAGDYFWISDEVVDALKHNVQHKRIMRRVHVPPSLTVATDEQVLGGLRDKDEGGNRVELSATEIDVINTTSNGDSKIKLLLTLVYINERKGGNVRNMISTTADRLGLYDQRSIGFFQVYPVPVDFEYLKTFGYEFADFEEYEKQLETDTRLNGIVAVSRLKNAMRAYDHFLNLNKERSDISDSHYVTAILTCYNRPARNFYGGMFSIMARNVSDAFGLDIDHTKHEKPHRVRSKLYGTGGIIHDIADKKLGVDMDFLLNTDDSIYGADQVGIMNFWKDVASSLISQEIISLTKEQKDHDYALLQESGFTDSYEVYSANPEMAAILIEQHKSTFLETELYKSIKKAYEDKVGDGSSLSLLISDKDYEETSVQNYGYRAVRYDQMQEIFDYSSSINTDQSKVADLEFPIDLASLKSVKHKLRSPLMDDSGALIATRSRRGPLKVKADYSTESSKIPDAVRVMGYERYGLPMYKPNMNYPVATSESDYPKPADIPPSLPLRDDTPLDPGADDSGWVPITMANGKTYYRAEYHLSGLELDESDLEIIARNDGNDKRRIEYMNRQGKLHIATFPLSDFDFVYCPGSTLLMQDASGKRKGFLKSGEVVVNPAAGEIKPEYTNLLDYDPSDVVGIFNGTYHQDDTGYQFEDSKRAQYAGLVLDRKEILSISPYMATIALYEDGRVKIGTYENLLDKDKIVRLRQNDVMVLENGELGAGATPDKFHRFQDNIVRSYLAMTPDGKQIAYVWSTHIPPEVFARIMKKAGFSDVMLLDVHSVISSSLRQPEYSSQQGREYYDFVPRVVGKVGSSFQWNPDAALSDSGSPHDFFAVVAKPQADRVARADVPDVDGASPEM